MNYPQPPYSPQPPYPPQGQQGYAPQPGYGAPNQPPQQPYYQQQPPPGYAPNYAPQPPAAPAPVAARGTLEDFMDQPTGGGGTAVTKFFGRPNQPQGSWLQLQVQRDHTHNDVKQQTDSNNNLQFFKTNGQPDFNRPKLVLIVQTNVLQSSDGSHPSVFTEGTASVWIKGITRDALVDAMRQANVQQPEKVLARGKIGGAVITMISAGEKPANRPGYSATKLYNFQYTPGGNEPLALVEDPTVTTSAPVQAPVNQVAGPSAPPPQQYAEVNQAQQYQQAPPQQLRPTPPVPSAQTVAPPAPPNGAGTPVAAPPAPPQGYAPVPPPPGPAGYAPPPTAPVPNGYAPAPPQLTQAPPMDPEKAATLARLNGGQG